MIQKHLKLSVEFHRMLPPPLLRNLRFGGYLMKYVRFSVIGAAGQKIVKLNQIIVDFQGKMLKFSACGGLRQESVYLGAPQAKILTF